MTTAQTSKLILKGVNDNFSGRFNPARLTFARARRGLKKTDLAKAINVTSRSITGYEAGEFPPENDRLDALVEVLRFPKAFFFEESQLEELDANAVSFRSMSKMGMALKSAALGAGAIAMTLDSWIQERFVLPKLDLPDFGRDMGPEAAAEALRLHWGLGEAPVKNMVHLLESKGVRIYSLAIDAREVDAFSTWWNGKAFVFLNTQKSAEHSRFDAAHELGHLVLHRHGAASGQDAEKEANAFASAFLMPRKSVLATQLRFPTLDTLIRVKKHWGVSVAALNYRLHTVGLTTEWINRSLCIQIASAGYRTNEPQSMSRETSQILEKVFKSLREDGVGKSTVAQDLYISPQEIEELTYGLLKLGAVPERSSVTSVAGEMPSPVRPTLKVVK